MTSFVVEVDGKSTTIVPKSIQTIGNLKFIGNGYLNKDDTWNEIYMQDFAYLLTHQNILKNNQNNLVVDVNNIKNQINNITYGGTNVGTIDDFISTFQAVVNG